MNAAIALTLKISEIKTFFPRVKDFYNLKFDHFFLFKIMLNHSTIALSNV